MKRRTFLKAGVGGLLGLGGGAGFAWVEHESQRIVVERISVPVSGLSDALEGVRIVALSDFHLHPFTQLEFLREAFVLARSLKPDLIVLLGDFVDSEVDAIEELQPALSDLDARLGVYSVLGNHDWRKGRAVVARGLEKAGVEVLENRGIYLGGKAGLWLGGIHSFYGDPNLGDSLNGSPSVATRILLAHEPDFADEVAADGRFHVQLSGHSHGGQVNIPGLVRAALPIGGRKYAFGSYQVGDLFVHTSRGLGMTGVPVRFRSPPEVTELTLTRKMSAEG